MVLFFTASDGHVMYMGKDKYENEDLIKYGLPEDLWFHVDSLSSAHVYLRLNKGERLEDIDPAIVMECAQLVKANSIEECYKGCKLKEVPVVYTRWRNLHKTADMDVGAIGYHDRTKVKRLRVIKDNSIVNALNRTKEERFPNLAELQEARAAEFRAEQRQLKKEQMMKEKADRRDREEKSKLRSFEGIMDESKMMSNTDFIASEDASAACDFEDGFM